MSLSKIHVHPFSYLTMIIALMTGMFKELSYFMILIIIHELGHISMALYYHWNIEKIVILPFGGITIFHEYLNRPLKEEFMITIMGPVFQIVGYFLLSYWIVNPLFQLDHYSILLFNLLPIFPLDGSKLLNVFCNKFFSYANSHILSIMISIFCIVFGMFFIWKNQFNLLLFLILFFLILKNYKEIKEHTLLIHKFQLERYLEHFHFSKYRVVHGTNLIKMKRDYRHIFQGQEKTMTEWELLRKKFDFHGKI